MSTAGLDGVAVAGAAVNQFVIPPLNDGDRIEN